MGQKINPNSFRLITTQKCLSKWYTLKKFYPIFLKEEYLFRIKADTFFNSLFLLSKIQINRNQYSGKRTILNILFLIEIPVKKEIYRKSFKYFKIKYLKFLNFRFFTQLFKESYSYFVKEYIAFLLISETKKFLTLVQKSLKNHISIKFKFIKNPFEDAILISKVIQKQLLEKIPYRRILNHVFEKVQAIKIIKGIKIQISGRLNGLDIARNEWKKEGRIPLHTLHAKIDYTNHIVNTSYGVMGIKVWLYKIL